MAKANRFADAVRKSIQDGFETQARAHGEALHKKAVELRQRDPLATFLLDTFTRQARDRAQRAEQAEIDGDERGAEELFRGVQIAVVNKNRVMAAVNDEEIACQ